MNAVENHDLSKLDPETHLKVLIVDDDRDITESLQDVLEIECEDYEVKTAHDIASAVTLANQFKPDIALLDIKLGNENGLDLITMLRQGTPDITCIMMTAFRDVEYAVQAIRNGADDFLYKPLDAENLVKTLNRFQLNHLLLRGKAEAERRFRAIFEQSFQYLYILDNEGVIQEMNTTALSLMNHNKEDLLGTPFSQAPWWKDNSEVASALSVAMKSEIVRKELAVIENGEEYIFDFTFKPVQDTSGQLAIIIPEGRDISERKSYEDKIVTLNQSLEERVLQRTELLRISQVEAESANIAKSEFLSHISHELRTPLNAIIGYSQLLTMGTNDNLTQIQLENINHIQEAGTHLLSLINQVLDLSQIEAGQLALQMESLDINQLVKQALTIVQPLLSKRSILISNHLADHSFPTLRADKQALTQVLINLISNAIKYNQDSGTIDLQAELVNDDYLRISITDTGHGIPEEIRNTIFEPFTRADSIRSIEGSGVGLTLCKKLITLMNGDINFTSQIAEGTTFWVDIPLDSHLR